MRAKLVGSSEKLSAMNDDDGNKFYEILKAFCKLIHICYVCVTNKIYKI